MAKTNFQIFNEENAPERTYNDSEYKEATQRIGGVMPGMALSRMHNKMYYQWSAMCKAIANLIVKHGHDCIDTDVEGITQNLEEAITNGATEGIKTHRTAAELDHPDGSVTTRKLADKSVTVAKAAPDLIAHIDNVGLHIRKNSTTYAVGDIAYSRSLPSWARLECVKAGTTGASILNLAEVRKCGVMVTDGNAVWIVDDVRDGARVGDIILRPTLRDGYIKANGSTVKASEYPRLLAWVQEAGMTVTAGQYAQDCSKYVYDAAQDKLTLPNMTGRVLQGGETVKSVEAGLPQHTHKLNGWVGTSAQKEINSGGFSVVDVATSDTSAGANNPIYGRSDTVQPPALHLIAQIKY